MALNGNGTGIPWILWRPDSTPSRVSRSVAVALLLALSVLSQQTSLLLFPGTNSYWGMVALHGTSAYSLIEDHVLASRAGDLRAIKGFDLRSRMQTQDYLPPADFGPALKRTAPGDVLFLYPPGYAIYLAGTYLVSHEYRYDLARRIQGILNMLGAPLLLVLTGIFLGCFTTGYAAAALYSLFSGTAIQTFYILPDGLMPFLLTLLLATSAWCARRDQPRRYLVLGMVLGVAANFRSDVLAVAPFLALGTWRFRNKLDTGTVARVLAIAVVAFALLIPYGLIQKNFKPIGQFQITAPALGQSLWFSLGETPNPYGATVSDAAIDQMLAKAGRHIFLPDGESYLKNAWLRAAVREPGWFVRSVAHREGVLLGYWRVGAKAPFLPVPYASPAAWQRILVKGATRTLSLIVLGLFVCGVLALLFSRLGLLVGAIPLGYFVAFSFLHLEQRYVLPSLGPLTYLGCHGAEVLVGRFRDLFRRAPG